MHNLYIRVVRPNSQNSANYGSNNNDMPEVPPFGPSSQPTLRGPAADLPRKQSADTRRTSGDGGAMRRYNGILTPQGTPQLRETLSSKDARVELAISGPAVTMKAIDGIVHLDAADGQKLKPAQVQLFVDVFQQPMLHDGAGYVPRVVFELRAPMDRPFGPFKRFYLGMLVNGRHVLPRQFVKLEDALDLLVESGARERGAVFVNKKSDGMLTLTPLDRNAFYELANALGAPVSCKQDLFKVEETTYRPET